MAAAVLNPQPEHQSAVVDCGALGANGLLERGRGLVDGVGACLLASRPGKG
jgi:hypothetical protein